MPVKLQVQTFSRQNVGNRTGNSQIDLVTPLPRNLSRSLIDSLRHDVVVTDRSITSAFR